MPEDSDSPSDQLLEGSAGASDDQIDNQSSGDERSQDADRADADAAQRQHLQWLEEATGYKLADRYQSDEALAQGVKHAFQLIGQRDEDASFGRAIRQRLSPEQVERLLAADDAAKPPRPDDKGDEPEDLLPASYQEYELLLEKARNHEDPNDPVYRRAVRAARALGQRSFETVRQFDEVRRELADVKKAMEDYQGRFQATTEEQRLREWSAAHAGELWQQDDPQRLTAFGEQVAHAYDTDPRCTSKPEKSLERWDLAYLVARANQPPVRQAREPGRGAMRQTGARKRTKQPSLDEMLQQGIDEVKAFEMLNQQYLAEEAGAGE